MIENYNALSGLVIGIVSFVILCYVAYLQALETSRPSDGLTGLRWRIFAIIAISIVSLVPALMYQYFRTIGVESEGLRNVATITSRISSLATIVLLLDVFRYRKKS